MREGSAVRTRARGWLRGCSGMLCDGVRIVGVGLCDWFCRFVALVLNNVFKTKATNLEQGGSCMFYSPQGRETLH